MQATNVKQVTKPELANKGINLVVNDQTEQVEVLNTAVKVAEVIELKKVPSFNRILEAYGDCV